MVKHYHSRIDVQSIVETPQMHMIGRSKSSVSEQLLYIPERIEELETTKAPIFINGRSYRDHVQFFSGQNGT